MDALLLLTLTVIRLDIDVLAHQQAVAAVQRHIEGVSAGGGHVAAAVRHPLIAAGDGILPVDGGDAALPDIAAHTGADQHLPPLGESGGVTLVDIALHPEARRLHDGHDGQCIPIAVSSAVFVHRLHPTVYRRGDLSLADAVGKALHLLLLQGDVILLLQNGRRSLPDLQIVLQLLIRGDVALVPLQPGLLLLLGAEGALHLVQLQLGFLQIQLCLRLVVGKEGLALFHLIPGLHGHGGHLPVLVLCDLCLALSADDSSEAIHLSHTAQAADHGYGFHRRLAFAAFSAARQAAQQQQRR